MSTPTSIAFWKERRKKLCQNNKNFPASWYIFFSLGPCIEIGFCSIFDKECFVAIRIKIWSLLSSDAVSGFGPTIKQIKITRTHERSEGFIEARWRARIYQSVRGKSESQSQPGRNKSSPRIPCNFLKQLLLFLIKGYLDFSHGQRR